MNLVTFFEKFEQFAEAPRGVEKMRELVLKMATTGHIAEQDPKDTPALHVLEQIVTQREKLIAKGLAKNRIEGSPISAGDTPEIPGSWVRCMISEVCDLQTGATPSRQEQRYFGGEIPWLVSGDVNKGEIVECEGRITELGLQESNCKIIPPNSVLIALNGQGKTRGTVAVLRIPAALNQSLVAMIPYSREHLLPEYIFWNLRGRYYAIRDITGQDQRRGLNMKIVSQLSLPIPPVAEQRRIVAKVTQLMALCTRLEAEQQERDARQVALSRAALDRFAKAATATNLEFLFHTSYSIPPADLRKSILTLAVEGRLVPQDPKDEPVETTFRGLEPLDQESTVNAAVPNQWRRCTYRSLTSLVTSGSRGWKEFYSKTGALFIRTQNIKTDRLVFDDVAFVKLPKSAEGMRAQVLENDILVTITGANVTKAARVENQIPEAYVSQHIALTRPRWPEMSAWLHLCFISHGSARGVLERLAYGDKPGLNLNNIRDLIMPVPPLAEQRRIATRVHQLLALVDDLEAQLTASTAAAASLLEAVVAELTTGPGVQSGGNSR